MASVGKTPSLNLNLPTGHAYSILGVKEIIDPKTKAQYKLIRIFNPHASDTKFNGSWADSDPKWKIYQNQVPEYL